MPKSLNKMLHYLGCMHSYGENCQHPCGKQCDNQTCNRFNGICQFGCESGYHGQKCDQGTCIFIWILTRKLFTIYLLPIFFFRSAYMFFIDLQTFNHFQYINFLKKISVNQLFILSSGFIGASVSAFLIIATAVGIFLIR